MATAKAAAPRRPRQCLPSSPLSLPARQAGRARAVRPYCLRRASPVRRRRMALMMRRRRLAKRIEAQETARSSRRRQRVKFAAVAIARMEDKRRLFLCTARNLEPSVESREAALPLLRRISRHALQNFRCCSRTAAGTLCRRRGVAILAASTARSRPARSPRCLSSRARARRRRAVVIIYTKHATQHAP